MCSDTVYFDNTCSKEQSSYLKEVVGSRYLREKLESSYLGEEIGINYLGEVLGSSYLGEMRMHDLNQSRARSSYDMVAEKELLYAPLHVVRFSGLIEEGVETAHRGIFFCSLLIKETKKHVTVEISGIFIRCKIYNKEN